MKTGFTELDQLMEIVRGELVVLASRPAMGKSTLMEQIYTNMARIGNEVMVWDFHQTEKEIVASLLSQASGIPKNKLRTAALSKGEQGKLDGIEVQQVVAATNEIEDLKIEIMDATKDKFWSWLESDTSFPDVVVVDFIQMVAKSYPPGPEIASIVKRLKEKAIQNNSVVFVLSQISRNVEDRAGHYPFLRDLSESAALEEVADKIIFLLRREYYDPLDKPGQGELILGKNRSGPVGGIRLAFRKDVPSFSDYYYPEEYTPNLAEEFEAFAAFTP